MERIGRFVRGFGRFWYDFIIGDDAKIAAAVAVVLVLGAVLVGPVGESGSAVVAGLAALLLVTFTIAMLVDVAISSRRRG